MARVIHTLHAYHNEAPETYACLSIYAHGKLEDLLGDDRLHVPCKKGTTDTLLRCGVYTVKVTMPGGYILPCKAFIYEDRPSSRVGRVCLIKELDSNGWIKCSSWFDRKVNNKP